MCGVPPPSSQRAPHAKCCLQGVQTSSSPIPPLTSPLCGLQVQGTCFLKEGSERWTHKTFMCFWSSVLERRPRALSVSSILVGSCWGAVCVPRSLIRGNKRRRRNWNPCRLCPAVTSLPQSPKALLAGVNSPASGTDQWSEAEEKQTPDTMQIHAKDAHSWIVCSLLSNQQPVLTALRSPQHRGLDLCSVLIQWKARSQFFL